MVVLVTAASVQDRDGGRLVLHKARMRMPSIALVWADAGYAGRCVAWPQPPDADRGNPPTPIDPFPNTF